jgi:hypothetical protein
MHTAKSDTSDEYVHELLNSFMVTGRYSTILERQIAFALWQRIANVHVICNEIGAIEKHPLAKSSRTKRDEALTGDLTGLRHKHLMDARFIAKNVFNHWAARDEELVQLCANVMADEAIPLDKKPGHIFHLVMASYEHRSRARRLTGEWIVFARHQKRNYYLSLASHSEQTRDILLRCLEASREFSELSQLVIELELRASSR